MTTKMLSTLALGLVIAGPALADAHKASMADMDTDGDAMLSMEEYRSGDERVGFTAYDMDSDGVLSEEEVAERGDDRIGFSAYDLDGGGDVSEDEYYEASFDAYDIDDDGMISQDEYLAYEEDRAGMMETSDG